VNSYGINYRLWVGAKTNQTHLRKTYSTSIMTIIDMKRHFVYQLWS